MTIAKQITRLGVPIESITPHPDNPRRGNVEALRESLRRFGQYKPIVVQAGTNYVVAGNHTLLAAREEGWKKIAAVVVEIDDDQARALLVADNRHSDTSRNDDAALAAILKGLAATGSLEGTGYSESSVDDLLALLQEAPIDPQGPGLSGRQDDKTYGEFLSKYQQSAVRAIVMEYPLEVYGWLAERLGELREKHGEPTNAALLLRLVADATGSEAPILAEPETVDA